MAGPDDGPVDVGSTPNRPYVFWSTLTKYGSRAGSLSFPSTQRNAFSGGARNLIYPRPPTYCSQCLFNRIETAGQVDIQIYPTTNPTRCPRKLELGTSAAMQSSKASGDVQVGMLYVAMTKYGLVLYVRIASAPNSRKAQILHAHNVSNSPSHTRPSTFSAGLPGPHDGRVRPQNVLLYPDIHERRDRRQCCQPDPVSTVARLHCHSEKGSRLTPKEQRQRSQRAILALEPLQQRDHRQQVQDQMKRVQVYQREGIRPIHCSGQQSASTTPRKKKPVRKKRPTGLDPNLVRYQRAPGPHVKRMLQPHHLEDHHGHQHRARKQRQPRYIRFQLREAEPGDVRKPHRV